MSDDLLFDAMGGLGPAYRAVDWAGTPLGPPDAWSPTLRAVLETIGRTRYPCTLFWGPERVMLYNEDYVPVLAEKHPAALGARTVEVFPEAWDYISDLIGRVTTTREAHFERDALVPLRRGGHVREAYFTFCYSAVCGPDGEVEGVLDIVAETTSSVVAARRLTLVDAVRDALADAADPAEVPARAAAVLGAGNGDFTAAAVAEEAETRAGVEVERSPDGTRSAVVGLTRPGRPDVRQRLRLQLDEAVEVDAGLLTTVRTIGSAVTDAVDRAAALVAERREATLARGFAEALQTTLLSDPQRIAGCDIEVRYVAAVDAAGVGGDWYDSFVVPGRGLLLSIGDVVGHDRTSAVAMAQARNILRGVAFASTGPPSEMLRTLDRAITSLQVAPAATAVVAWLDPPDPPSYDAGGGPGAWRLTWSNAGHPPPVLIGVDGDVSTLAPTPEALLGLDLGVVRRDHRVDLAPGSTLVLHTDGLVERRDEHWDVGVERLRAALRGSHTRPTADIADELTALGGGRQEDDLAVMVVRVGVGA